MNLGEIRTLFIERSGRNDLIDSEDADNGANFFIQSGQRMLDRMLEVDKSWGRSFKTLVAGDYYAIFKGCRAIKGVWYSTVDGRDRLIKVTQREMRELYYEDAPSDVTQGTTLRYCMVSLRTYPDDDKVVLDYLYDDKLTNDATEDYEYTGIIFSPPPDEGAQLEVFGLFRSPDLTEDADESYWTVMNPEIILMAALYQLEVSYRNTEGANDWMTAILRETVNLEKDFIESQIADVDQIVG